MSWLHDLLVTYDNCIDKVDCDLPYIYHRRVKAHIIVILNESGELVDANLINDKKFMAQIPVTEKSGNSSKRAPHPLAEEIRYCAGDYPEYATEQNSKFDDYIKQLSDWCNSSYTNPKLNIILKYLQKKTLVSDLVKLGIIKLDENNKLSNEEKTKQDRLLIIWKVEILDDIESDTWKDKAIINAWQNYYRTQSDKIGMCQVTGEENVPIATLHPKNIRYYGDSGKLISKPTNSSYCTYKGELFSTPDEACTISREVSEKTMASVLPWLVKKQGFRNGKQVIIVWHPGNKEIPQPIIENNFNEFGFLHNGDEDKVIDNTVNVAESYAIRFNKAVAGYQQNIDDCDQINVITLDSCTDGRIAISYRTLMGSTYINTLAKWYSDFAWPILSKKLNEFIVQPPTYYHIIEAAYGGYVPDSHKKKIINEIFNCIINGVSLPSILLKAAVNSTNNRANKNLFKWRRSLSITCALCKGYYARHPNVNKRRLYKMTLDRELTTRDYLWGRLLAVAYAIENSALKLKNLNRLTSSEKLYSKFSLHPLSTWNKIVIKLQPYKNDLKKANKIGLLIYYQKELDEIVGKFLENDYKSDKALSGEHWIGYMCQVKELFTSKKQSTQEKENE